MFLELGDLNISNQYQKYSFSEKETKTVKGGRNLRKSKKKGRAKQRIGSGGTLQHTTNWFYPPSYPSQHCLGSHVYYLLRVLKGKGLSG